MEINISLSRVTVNGTDRETFIFGNFKFDIAKLRRLLKQNKLNPEKEKVDTAPWAEEVLKLDKRRPDHKPRSFFVNLDYDHLDTLKASDLKEPVLIVDLPEGLIVIDGNHRIAKAYMAGKKKVDALVFGTEDAKKFSIGL